MRESENQRRIIRIADEQGIVNDGEALYSRGHLMGVVGPDRGFIRCNGATTRPFLRFVKRAFPFLRWKLTTFKQCGDRHLLWRSATKYARWVCGCVEMEWSDYIWQLIKIDKNQTTLEVGNDQLEDGKETANRE